MKTLIPNLLGRLEYKITQAHHYKTYHYCEICKMFSPKRPCKFGHDKRYWALRHFRNLHHKISNGYTLNTQDLILLEAISE